MSQTSQSWDSHRARWQQISNELAIPPRREQRDASPPIPVRARIVWERDGVEHVDTTAIAWTQAAVLVELYDVRYLVHGVWLPPNDVERR